MTKEINEFGNCKPKMKVLIRIRPCNSEEISGNFRNVIDVKNNYELLFAPKEDEVPFSYQEVKQNWRDVTKKRNKEINFIFDRLYDHRCTTTDIYNESIRNILSSLFDGYNCSVFVYGSTGTGKTFTMAGNRDHPGVMFLTVQDLFRKIDEVKDTKKVSLAASYVEVYNDNIRDLLKSTACSLQLREDPVEGVILTNVTWVEVVSAEQLLFLLNVGSSNRTQYPTAVNSESSRSHAVFQVLLSIQDQNSDQQLKLVKMTMVDLAGSERGAVTNFRGMRFKERANINVSLLALGNCIKKLADGVKHIPYRDSKLTYLLKNCFVGNSKTVMIACVAPTVCSYDDTYNTLKYAMRANSFKMTLPRNIKKNTGDYRKMIHRLENNILESEKDNKEYKQMTYTSQKENLDLEKANNKISAANNELITEYETGQNRKTDSETDDHKACELLDMNDRKGITYRRKVSNSRSI